MKKYRCKDVFRLCSISLVVLASLMFSSASQASDVRNLWQSRDQFVALDRQESPKDGAVILNDHPVELSEGRLTALLTSIEFHSEDSGKPEQLITSQSIEVLAPQIVLAFRKAAPGDDVTFAIIGLHKAMYGFAKSPKVTTGRMFYKAGKLNIIFGLVRKDFNEREDRRLSPLSPGSRNKAAEGEWTLLAQPNQKGYNQVRKDWVTFSDEWQAPVSQVPVPVQNVPSAQTTPAQFGRQKNDTRTPAERLTTLNELKDKGLISEEEYRTKRLDILNGL